MRKIELERRTTRATKERVAAVVWACARRGNVAWTGKNVPIFIHKYLRDNHVKAAFDSTTHQVRYAMELLVEDGYAEIKRNDNGRIVEHFRIKSDVDLTSLPEPEFFAPSIAGAESSKPVITTNVGPSQVLPPLPPLPLIRYKARELEALLDAWAVKDSDKYAEWVDAVVANLNVVLEQP